MIMKLWLPYQPRQLGPNPIHLGSDCGLRVIPEPEGMGITGGQGGLEQGERVGHECPGG